MGEAPTLVLVDGSSYLYRAFHALPPLTNSRGEPTGAVLGVLNMLAKLQKELEPTYVAVVFDAPGRTFRDDLFAEYKAHRPPMPDDLRAQTGPLIEAVEALGLPLLRVEGVEADDVIGTLAGRAAREGLRVVISTGDKDMAQLVNDRISLVNTMTGSSLDRAGVKIKFDVYPEQIVDYLALMGDASDNIPGVPKVGPKTAARWLNQYTTVDNLLEHQGEIEGKVGESLREHTSDLALSRQLATINCNLELTLQTSDLKPTAPDVDRLRALYSRLELRSLLKQLPGDESSPLLAPLPSPADAGEGGLRPADGPALERNYELVLTQDAFESWLQRLETAELISFDTETTSLDYMRAEIVGVSFCVEAGRAAYVPLAHTYPGAPDQLDRTTVLDTLRPLLEDPARAKLGHHLKYDAHVLRNHGIELRGMKFDSMLESYVLNSTATRHDLDSTAQLYLGVQTIHFEDVAGKGAKQLPFNEVPIETAGEYSAEDADIALRLHRALWPRIEQLPKLRRLYEEIERPLVPVLLDMEHRGVLIDTAMLKKQSHELAKKLVELEARAHAVAGAPFNLDSPKQLQEVLFGKLGLPTRRKTATGQPSTAEDVLEELADDYELPRIILDYRGMAKLRSTYTDKLPGQVDPGTGRVHTSYHQAVAATGRLSSTDPNLQNIPIRTPEGRRIRQAFIAPPGHVLMAADYSQIELRIMAHLSEDEGLIDAFRSGEDLHTTVASRVFSVPPEAVDAEMRRRIKAMSYGLAYGLSVYGLSQQLGISPDEAKGLMTEYFTRFGGVRDYLAEVVERARVHGYTETMMGRRRFLPDLNSDNRQRREMAERMALNAPIQGSAADIVKVSMLSVQAALEEADLRSRLLLQVHDELVLEVAPGEREAVEALVRTAMAGAAALSVPLDVSVGFGASWEAAAH